MYFEWLKWFKSSQKLERPWPLILEPKSETQPLGSRVEGGTLNEALKVAWEEHWGTHSKEEIEIVWAWIREKEVHFPRERDGTHPKNRFNIKKKVQCIYWRLYNIFKGLYNKFLCIEIKEVIFYGIFIWCTRNM